MLCWRTPCDPTPLPRLTHQGVKERRGAGREARYPGGGAGGSPAHLEQPVIAPFNDARRRSAPPQYAYRAGLAWLEGLLVGRAQSRSTSSSVTRPSSVK